MLALLRDRRRYALEVTRALSATEVLAAGEGTLYPLLGRLRRRGAITSSWEESTKGPPRRYYEITQSGRDALKRFEHEWVALRDAVDAMLGGEKP